MPSPNSTKYPKTCTTSPRLEHRYASKSRKFGSLTDFYLLCAYEYPTDSLRRLNRLLELFCTTAVNILWRFVKSLVISCWCVRFKFIVFELVHGLNCPKIHPTWKIFLGSNFGQFFKIYSIKVVWNRCHKFDMVISVLHTDLIKVYLFIYCIPILMWGVSLTVSAAVRLWHSV